MKPFTFDIGDDLINKYERLSAGEKDKIRQVLGRILEEILKDEQVKSLESLIQQANNQAQQSGLGVPEFIELMGWDDSTARNIFGRSRIKDVQ